MIDDEAIESKVRGCKLLAILLGKTTCSLLQRTGLGEVFMASLLPCLSYLPSLTPEEESIRLLDSVYPTLLTLIQARFPNAEMADASRKTDPEKLKLLDGIIRLGIFRGHAYAGDSVKIADLLVRNLSHVIHAMGIWSVRHLKVFYLDIIRVYNQRLILQRI